MTRRPDAPAVATLLAERMPELARDLLGKPNRALSRRDEWRSGRNGSLSVMAGDPKRDAWHDHEACTGGDVLGLVVHACREPIDAAYGWALAWLGIAGGRYPSPAPRPTPAPPQSPRKGVAVAMTPETHSASSCLPLPESGRLRLCQHAGNDTAVGHRAERVPGASTGRVRPIGVRTMSGGRVVGRRVGRRTAASLDVTERGGSSTAHNTAKPGITFSEGQALRPAFIGGLPA